MRSKNLFVILCIPNFFELDRYPAMHRSTGLIHINKRRSFGSYDYKKKKQLYLVGKKTYSYITSPSFIGAFTKYFPLNQEEYEAKKQEAISQWSKTKGKYEKLQEQRDVLIKYLVEEKVLNVKELSEKIKLTERQVYRVLT